MNYDYILCRYGELSTKGKNRRNFTAQLLRNVKERLIQYPELTYKESYDRLYVILNGTPGLEVATALQDVFGLSSMSLAMKVAPDIDAIVNTAHALIQDEEGTTFKVITRRHDKTFDMSSDDVNRAVATKILQSLDLKVDVKTPEIKVLVEIRKDAAYIMMGQLKGSGGYPVGIQGRALMLLSGGIDSPVASYLMMKRGVRVEMIHFASPPYTSDGALNKVMTLAQALTPYQSNITVHIVNFTDIQLEIYRQVPESYAITIMRRFFIRVSEALANKRDLLALANGESLGQVASQTLHSMKSITDIATLPILRPLLSYDKLEIIDVAKSIGTYETSILPFEDCCTIFTPKAPTTKPNERKIAFYEAKLDIEGLVAMALEQTERRYVSMLDQEESFL